MICDTWIICLIKFITMSMPHATLIEVWSSLVPSPSCPYASLLPLQVPCRIPRIPRDENPKALELVPFPKILCRSTHLQLIAPQALCKPRSCREKSEQSIRKHKKARKCNQHFNITSCQMQTSSRSSCLVIEIHTSRIGASPSIQKPWTFLNKSVLF